MVAVGCKPPFKIPGGKRLLAAQIVEHMPGRASAYVEPFVGGGAVFLAWDARRQRPSPPLPTNITLADGCPTTASIWKAIRDTPTDLTVRLLIANAEYELGSAEEREAMYYRERETWNANPGGHAHEPWRALFLRATGFNGLWRVSKAGQMNTPFGKYKSFKVPDIAALSERIQMINIAHQDFETTLADDSSAVPVGAVVYVDPPYDGGFTAYTTNGFSDEQQMRLLIRCADLARKGRCVIYSNACTEKILGMIAATWPDAKVHYVTAKRSIACRADARGSAREVLVVGGSV